jgi:hypothetical protein
MLERATLQVLAEVAEIGLAEAVDVPMAAYDPILRPVLRRNVRRALAAAGHVEPRAGEHRLYLAFVLRHPSCPAGLDPSNERAVLEAYRTLSEPFTGIPAHQALRPRPGAYRASADPHGASPAALKVPKRRRWIITPSLVAVLLSTVAGLGLWYAAPYFMPTAEERFRKTALGVSLDDPLTDFVSAIGRGKDADARSLLLAPDVQKQIGPKAFADLTQVADLVPETTVAIAPSTDVAAAPLFAAINGLNEELYQRKVPALLLGYAQGEAPKRGVWVTSYFVQRRNELLLDGHPVRVVWGRRIDSLNLVDDALYKAEAEEWAVLSLERIEDELVKLLLGSMAEGAPLGPTEYHPTDSSPRASLARALGPLLAEEMEAKAHLTPEDAERAFRALATRNAAVLDLRGLGYSLETSSRFQLAPWLVRRMVRARGGRPGDRALIEELLRMNDRMRVYRQSVAPAVDELALLEEEEFAGKLFAEDDPAKAREGSDLPAALRPVASSELAMLTRPQDCPRLALWRVASMAYQPLSGGDYQIGSRIVEALFSQLALPGLPDDFDSRDKAFEDALLATMRMPPEHVRDAATRAYKQLFDAAPPVLARKTL